MDSVRDERTLLRPGSPIRASSDRCLLAAPRGLSQLATPFIASRRQGIHRSPLVACPQTDGEHRLAALENLRIRFSKIGASKTRTIRRLFASGGDDRIRTGDPLLAKQVLSQLSYIPACRLVGLPGIEPGTSRL